MGALDAVAEKGTVYQRSRRSAGGWGYPGEQVVVLGPAGRFVTDVERKRHHRAESAEPVHIDVPLIQVRYVSGARRGKTATWSVGYHQDHFTTV